MTYGYKGQSSKAGNRSHRAGLLLGAAAAVGFLGMMIPSAHGAAINVALANFSNSTTTTGSTANNGIVPLDWSANSMTPFVADIPVAPGQTYDAADTTDSGTKWNSIPSVNTPPPVTSSSTPGDVVLYQTNIPLVDSSGTATSITMDVSAIEGSGKNNYIHTGANTSAGTDSLLPNPGSVAAGTGANNGYASGSSQQLLMGNEWISNGTSDGMLFTLRGLTPGTYNVYVYGAGNSGSGGQGATFTLDAANGGASVSTNAVAGVEHNSVFDSTGIDPLPEKGLSWDVMTATVDSSGVLSFRAATSPGGIKPAVNGFQIDAVGSAVPEPASLGLLACGGLALLGRRRRKA